MNREVSISLNRYLSRSKMLGLDNARDMRFRYSTYRFPYAGHRQAWIPEILFDADR